MGNLKIHPTHFKITSNVAGLLLIFSIVSFVVGIYFQQKGLIEFSHNFAFSFLINTVLLLLWLFFRMKLCKCPTCGKMLYKLVPEDKDKSRKFTCEECDIVWDSGYVMYFEMDDPS